MFTDGLAFRETLAPTVRRGREFSDQFEPVGTYRIQHIRDGEIIAEFDQPNAINDTAKNSILDAFFNNGTRYSGTAWCMSLINNAGLTATQASDTAASHSGWTEYGVYTSPGIAGTARPAWTQGSAASKTVTNGTAVEFDFTASAQVAGIFIVSEAVKAATTGILWSTALFTAPLSVANGDQLRVTYAVAT